MVRWMSQGCFQGLLIPRLKVVAGSPKALSLLGRNGCLDYQGPFARTQCELL